MNGETKSDARLEAAQKMEQDRLFREREGITAQHTLEFSEQLPKWLSTYYAARPGTFSKERVRNIATNFISGYLDTRFDSRHEQVVLAQLVAGKEGDYYEELDKNILPTYGKRGYGVSPEGEYFQITPLGWQEAQKQRPTFVSPRGGKVAIQYKEYFTFVPLGKNAAENIAETKIFHAGLLEAHAKVQNLASERLWNIPLKFAGDLKKLVTNLDNVVFYVPNPEAGQEIRAIVEQEMKERGIRLGGSGRARSGFDVIYPDGTELSHRQLIAQATSKWLEDDFAGPRRLLQMRKKDIAQQLFVRVRSYGKMEPGPLAQAART